MSNELLEKINSAQIKKQRWVRKTKIHKIDFKNNINLTYYILQVKMDAVKVFNSNQLHTEIVIKGTDDEPLFRAMNYPFKIKFTIFDENKVVSKKKQKLKQNIMDYGLKDLIKSSFNNDDNFQFLNRCEPAISSIDENKQLRLENSFNCISHYLHFDQSHSDDNFTIEEFIYFIM